MSSSFETKVEGAWDALKKRSVPTTARAVAMGAILWGAAALGYGLTVADRAWTWGAVIVAIVYGLGITQGAVMFTVIQAGVQGRWGRPLKRIAESIALALPFVYALFLVFLIAGVTVYPWHPNTITGMIEHDKFTGTPIALAPHFSESPHAKELWLSPTFFVVRHALAGLFMMLLDFWFIRATMRADMIAATKRNGAGPAWWGLFMGGETDEKKAAKDGAVTQSAMVPLMVVTYFLVMSMVAFDLIMSLDPWWFSNMFGGWIFMSSLWMALNFIGAFAMIGRDWLDLKSWVTTSTTHDLGRFMLAGCMFWAYTLFAQILPYYYTNVPEETNFMLVRLFLPQWNPMARVVAVMCFLAPFTILLSRGIKKMRWPFVALNTLILTGLFLERSLLVVPSVHAGPVVPWGQFAFLNAGLVAGVIGVIVLVATSVLAKLPAVPVEDPFLEPHPWDVHVHSLDHHHGASHHA